MEPRFIAGLTGRWLALSIIVCAQAFVNREKIMGLWRERERTAERAGVAIKKGVLCVCVGVRVSGACVGDDDETRRPDNAKQKRLDEREREKRGRGGRRER